MLESTSLRVRLLKPEAAVGKRVIRPFTGSYKFLLAFRIIALGYSLFVLGVQIYLNVPSIAVFFFYYTNLSYIALVVYFGCVTIFSLVYLNTESNPTGFLIFLNIFYSIVFTSHVLVPIIYWTFLAEKKDSDITRFANFSVHAIDLVLIFIDSLMNCFTMYPIHVIFFLIVLFVYVCWTWIASVIFVSASGGKFWVYSFLNLDSPQAYIWYLGLMFGSIVLYFVCVLYHFVRDKIRFLTVQYNPKSIRSEEYALNNI